MRTPSYQRSQWIWPLWIATPAVTLAAAGGLRVGLSRDDVIATVCVAGVSLAVLLVLGKLTVEIDETRLRWRFGLLGWPRWQVMLADIASVEKASTRFIDGWGIRKTREGMLYNASGYGAVRLRLRDGRTLRLGTDEPERLAGFIAARLRRPG